MKSRLDRLEARLQAAIEKRLPWSRGQDPISTAQAQIRTELQNLSRHSGDRLLLPDNYTLYLSVERLNDWMSQPNILEELNEFVRQEAKSMGGTFTQPPLIRLAADPTFEGITMRVHADFRQENLDHTATLPIGSEPEEAAAIPEGPAPNDAFLIVNGTHIFAIEQGVINIGRRPDNDLVVDDARVSRSHAQIRNVQGTYILFDLNSTGGTYVNNERVAQCSLQPGDVISLAGVQLIYGEDNPSSSTSTGSTSQIKPSAT